MPQTDHLEAIEKRRWSAADNLRANSNYASNEYFLPVMGLIFLRHAYNRYLAVRDDIEANLPKRGGKTRALSKEDFSQKSAIYLRPKARFDDLVGLTDSDDRANAVIAAMEAIEANNRRRIQLLEQAARLLYKEWFVHLRFPGCEHIKVKNGVPEGWGMVNISEFCAVRRGGSPRPIKNFLNGTVPWFKIGDATASESPFVNSTAEMIVESGVNKSVLLPPKELILSNSATCGIPYFTGISGCIHDGWLYFKDLRRVSKWFLYCCLFAKQGAILSGIGDGAEESQYGLHRTTTCATAKVSHTS